MNTGRHGDRRAGRKGRRRAGARRLGEEQPQKSRKPPWGRVILVAAIVLAVAGTTAVGVATKRESDHKVDAATRGGPSVQRQASSPAATPKVTGPVLKKAAPIAVKIRQIGVEARLLSLGLRTDGTIQVPPVKDADKAGWYRASPSPGEPGPSVIIGHVAKQKGNPRPVFKKLDKMKKGQRVEVARTDRKIAVFEVTKVASYPATKFPADEVYGPVDHAALRLITCGIPGVKPPPGQQNVVVYAQLKTSYPAGRN